MPGQDEYRKQLEDCGFENIEFEDLTNTWTQWTIARRDRFLANSEEHIRMHGDQVYRNMETFYNTVASLFLGGRLAGARITGSKGINNQDLDAGRKLIKCRTRGSKEILDNVYRQI